MDHRFVPLGERLEDLVMLKKFVNFGEQVEGERGGGCVALHVALLP